MGKSIATFLAATVVAWQIAVVEAGPTIVIGNHDLLPNAPNQAIDIYVSSNGTPIGNSGKGGATVVQGVMLNLQVAGGGPSLDSDLLGPIIQSHGPNNVDVTGNPLPGFGPYAVTTDLIGPGTLFHADNNGLVDSDTSGFPDYTPLFPNAMFHYLGTTTANGTVTIPFAAVAGPKVGQLLARLYIDTTGFTASSPGDLGPGKWSLKVLDTFNDATSFNARPGGVIFPAKGADGSITIVPERPR